MRTGFLTALVFALVLFAGCQVSTRVPEGRPDWVVAPGGLDASAKFVLAVGAAQPGPDETAAQKKAERDARGKLDSAVSDYVSESVLLFLESRAEYGDPSADSSKEFAAALGAEACGAVLRRATLSASWRDPADGRLHVLYRVPVSAVNGEINRRGPTALEQANPFGDLADEALREMGRFLDSELRYRLKAAAVEETPEPAVRRKKPVPEWLASGLHPEYPGERFATAVGLGADREEAASPALDELAGQINADIKNRFLSPATPDAEDAASVNILSVAEETLAVTADDLSDARPLKSWYDGVTDTYYVLAVLDRRKAVADWVKRIESDRLQARELSESGRSQHRAGNHVIALQDYLEALAMAQEGLKLTLLAGVLEHERQEEFREMLHGCLAATIKGEVRRLLGEISVEKAGGDKQWTAPGRPLAEPLSVRLAAGGTAKPLAALPVRFAFVQGDGELQETGVTDGRGVASCEVRQVQQSVFTVTRIEARLDLDAMADGVDFSGVTAPAVEFGCVLRARQNSFFALYVDEKTVEGQTRDSQVGSDCVREALSQEGFVLIDGATVIERVGTDALSGESTPDELAIAFSGLMAAEEKRGFLMLVIGRIGLSLVETTSTSEGELFIVEAGVTLRLIDVSLAAGERTVLVVTKAGKGAFTDDVERAARRASESAATVAAKELAAALRRIYGTD